MRTSLIKEHRKGRHGALHLLVCFFSSGIPQEMYVGNGSYTLGLTGVKTGGYHNLTLD